MKKFLKYIIIALVIIICIPFLPPIYKKYTRPFYNNYMAQKEWYGKVDCEDLSAVKKFCQRRGYNTQYYILVDFSIPSGQKRFFIYDLQQGKQVMSSYCMHGSGKGNTDAKPKFSNDIGSGCSSLGRYVMVGRGSSKFKNCVRLRGLDKSNYLAETRGILIHAAGKVNRFSGKKDYIPIGNESLGCFVVSSACVQKVMDIYRASSRNSPVMIYAKY